MTYDAAYEGVARSLLGRTAVAEDLDYAVAIARKYGYRFRVVTLDGQVVNAGRLHDRRFLRQGGGASVPPRGNRTDSERAAALGEKAKQARERFRQLRRRPPPPRRI